MTETTLDNFLKGSVSVARKVSMPNYGSLSLEYSEEFLLSKETHEEVADRLVEKVKAKLVEWGAAK